jgi:hypothetical protein
MQLYLALDPEADADDVARARAMATRARRLIKVAKSDAERRLLDYLPRDVASAREDFSFDKLGDEQGSTNLAQTALLRLAVGDHADGARVLARWDVPSVMDGGALGESEAFHDDVADLAAEIRGLMDSPSRMPLSEAIVRAMYKLLNLGEPLEAIGAKRRRNGH